MHFYFIGITGIFRLFLQFYIFRVLKKIREDREKGEVVCPDLPSQAFYPILADMVIKKKTDKISARE